MKSNYKTVTIITILLIVLSVSISLTNYIVALNATQRQLKTQALPLSLDNIYSEIQKHIVEPHLVSSMMAHDTFVKDWISSGEHNVEKIAKYLDAIKNKYSMSTAFLVVDKTKNYYTNEGLLKTISKENIDDDWYFNFQKSSQDHEINLDFNKDISEYMMMFINVKIFDNNFNLLGITGIGIKISHISEMLRQFHKAYNFKVYFINDAGDIILAENKNIKNISQIQELAIHKETIISKGTNVIEYTKDNNSYIVNTKFIPELNLYLLVEANVESFIQDVKRVFYFDLIISLFVTLIVAFIIINIVKKNQKEMQDLAERDSLTGLKNRRIFSESFAYFLRLFKRDNTPLCLAFIDLDSFKAINDTYGHNIGDIVLKRTSKILRQNIRSTDICARWGGEEFVILFINTNIDEAQEITNKLLVNIQSDRDLNEHVNDGVTASFGLTQCQDTDTIDSVINRADNAMYEAKNNGKNQIIIR